MSKNVKFLSTFQKEPPADSSDLTRWRRVTYSSINRDIVLLGSLPTEKPIDGQRMTDAEIARTRIATFRARLPNLL